MCANLHIIMEIELLHIHTLEYERAAAFHPHQHSSPSPLRPNTSSHMQNWPTHRRPASHPPTELKTERDDNGRKYLKCLCAECGVGDERRKEKRATEQSWAIVHAYQPRLPACLNQQPAASHVMSSTTTTGVVHLG